ncbi:balbiani ring protein 3 [Exaiptasia diaphana]|uniref:Uncharacterized protein n=1 Tax=Exaiptasia diaphana TaxID=2652724 RepID=A0A913XQQ8_EXADI|nr:balbiani ring protein 3 [Exaiptasia diaphana]XP_020907752.1 balbiani ring protein 3 [Exaiptasia diaphana]XP_020907753.1 balbiani ring protein 3 [Exaiptasia diaphana]KXJ10192.1 Vascular endothelial growth factor C [Exaiptasia diaphana]
MATLMLIIYVLIAVVQYSGLSGGIEMQYCTPRPQLIAIDSPYFNYFPYFVQLHRCGGTCSAVSPRIQTCSAATTKTISKTVYDLSRGSVATVLQLVNHTSCNCSCTQSPGSCAKDLEIWNPDSCSCKCKIPVGQSHPCPINFKWNQHICKCICDLAPKVCDVDKEWNTDYCGCLCSPDAFKRCAKQNQQIDKDTCACYSGSPPDIAARGGSGVNRNVMIGCMFAELFLLLLLFDVFLYCRYGHGVLTFLQGKCCSKKRQERREPVPLQKNSPEKC